MYNEKEYQKEYQKKYRAKHREQRLAWYVLHREEILAKSNLPGVKEKQRLIARMKHRKRNLLLDNSKTPKGRIRKKLRNAVASGKVIKSNQCSICGVGGLIHGHHKDYNKPFEVIWVCPLCHTKIHYGCGIIYKRRKK